MPITIPNHLRPRRDKIFGPAPAHPLDGNAKARVWAAASAYNATCRQPRQHQGPLTWASLRVLRVLLWRFHGADGGGRCFPSYEKIAATAKCARSTVALAIKNLEEANIVTWVHRLTKVRRRERDLFGHWCSEWQVLRSSNGYRLLDPLDRMRGRFPCKSENRTGPAEPRKNLEGARPDGAPVMSEEPSRPPPVSPDTPVIALRREHGADDGVRLSHTELAALIARQDAGLATAADWRAYERWVEAKIGARAS